MHRTLGDNYDIVDGKRVYRDEIPGVAPPTQVRHEEMNALQEEISRVIEAAGFSLNAGTEAISDMDQMNTAIDSKIGVEGAVRAAADTALSAAIAALNASDINNDSGVSGTNVDDALDNLDTAIANKVMRGYFDGFQTTVDTDTASPDVWMDFYPGFCMDSLNQMPIVYTGSAMRKNINAVWAAGHNSGGWAGSVGSVRSDVYSYCFVIYRNSDGNVDFGFDDNPNCSNLLAASGYDRYRRVESCLWTGTAIRPQRRDGDWVLHFKDFISETVDLNTGSGGFVLGTEIVFPNPDAAFGNRELIGREIREIAFGITPPVNNDSGSGVYVNIWPNTMSSFFAVDGAKYLCDASNDDSGVEHFQSYFIKHYPEDTDLGGRVMLLSPATPSAACNITYRCYGFKDTRGRMLP